MIKLLIGNVVDMALEAWGRKLVVEDVPKIPSTELVVLGHPLRRSTGREGARVTNVAGFPGSIAMLDAIDGRVEIGGVFPWCCAPELHYRRCPEIEGCIDISGGALNNGEVVLREVELHPRSEGLPGVGIQAILRGGWWW